MKNLLTILIVLFCIILNSCKEKDNLSKKFNEITTVDSTKIYRGDFHFSPQKGWMNDPNGLVFFEDEYHLFYQYHPDSTVWGPMHWGHAVSKDLIRWENLPIAIYPDSIGTIFSGSVVIDKTNSAGFGVNAMIAIFTQHNHAGEDAKTLTFQNQSIAYSLDKGRTFKKYDGNPVIKNPGIKDFRDPKVFWHDDTKKWVMSLAAYDKVIFYNSPDLKSWTKTGEFGINGDDRLWECPDLVQLFDENKNETKWALIVSMQKKAPNGGTGTSYFIGDFDGKTFKSNSKNQQWLDYGKDNYAFVTFSNLDKNNVQGIGWMSNWEYAQVTPTKGWRSAMTFPRQLSLELTANRYLLKSFPIGATNDLIGKLKKEIKEANIPLVFPLDKKCDGKKYRIKIEYPYSKDDGITYIKFYNDFNEELRVGFDPTKKQFFVDRRKAGNVNFHEKFSGIHFAPMMVDSGKVDLDIILDNASVELFANGYRSVITDNFYMNPISNIDFISEKKPLKFLNGTIFELTK
jgi:fructan beta-fructosidase